MDIAETLAELSEYEAFEQEVIARQKAATTDAQRFECERMRRIAQTVIFALLNSLTRSVADERIGRADDQAAHRQAAA